ncbi:Histidine kinase-, DNA gyrase B-, and HSP90-like ATPase [Thermanaeromonas toyohensis ToBE]|uniref:Histidine kinase-, DNA gyrase B-, and HSP90-like ATPase n=1 Tax=Thermanaeromonas toyohensis ToBE TaxID=698762 RepID=A0A1W1VRG2_9FIRM|nr:ATP-binding protein [Thermanaeromonas toyohensis]SMB95938.1 Histidine kinase-, DNA gyrase B-, and HSP90-like ATPase [Thermanaeromonas toyohensis ToBE]
MDTFDLTPDPKVLIALTHTPMQPLDALCELIDNAIDSFQTAKLQGIPVEHPLVVIDLPRPSDIKHGGGSIRVRDNGPGLTRDMAEKALRAGFSGNNPFDSLGLFGMGFNISTGKLGRVTRFLTARKEEDTAIEVVIDLEQIRQSGSYRVPFSRKQKEFEHGTLVEISGWWPEGNPNSGFVRKLVQYGIPKVREEIGRRYATILRERGVRIIINGDPCEPFEHCVWSDSRYVERKGYGKIPAVFRFNEVVGTQIRCCSCTALVPAGHKQCPACGSSNLRTIEERIRGWVGIQRFDHPTDFGIDLIRNGRAIRIGEKAAFFEYVDEFKRTIKDYPIDQPYGRIVGEVHLDHVPVDFLKQDFQRTSPEWQRAMSFLRGDSSLQPNQPGADQNNSPLFKLYQGYRRVRVPGKTDLYMGYWDPEKKRPVRVSRDVEREFYERFKRREPGYYDDTEWWKLVEEADKPPLEELVECPECAAQNLKTSEVCTVCERVLIGKTCLNPECRQFIPKSAPSCPHCGTLQEPQVQEPWKCLVCGRRNSPDEKTCSSCGMQRGTENTLSKEYLLKHSYKSDELSIPGCTVLLADGSRSAPVDVDTYITKVPISPPDQPDKQVPLIAFKGEKIEVFVDKNHRLFKTFRVRPEQMIAAEVALFLYDYNRRLCAQQQYQGLHTLSNLQWEILDMRWSDALEDSAERLREDILAFFDALRQRLPHLLGERAKDIFNDLSDDQKKHLVNNLLGRNIDISNLGDMKQSGEYLYYIDEQTVVDIFHKYPEEFFDGKFWQVTYAGISGLPDVAVEQARKSIVATYLNCLEDVSSFLRYRAPEAIITQRARMSLEFLQQKVV